MFRTRGALSTSTYEEISPIFLGQNKTETMFMTFFYTKHTDISWFDGGNPDFFLHCFGIFYVHVQVSRYKTS